MTVLITGAARGIGLGLARGLAAQGQAVVGTYRGEMPAQAPNIDWQPLEVTDPASHAALAGRLPGRGLSLLVCNAGVYLDKGIAAGSPIPPDIWERTFAVNVTGVHLTVQAMLPLLARAEAPKIAIIGSAMGSDARAPGGAYVYRASKAAVLNLGRNLAADLRARGIAVGIFHPGWVRTDMGGVGADLDLSTSVTGLMARFADLSLADTGCFRGPDGAAIPF